MELPDELYERITELSEQGNDLMDNEDPAGAIVSWSSALSLLPSPKEQWEAYTWLCASLGDAFFSLGKVAQSFDCFMDAMNGPDGQVNPFILYRAGQCCEALGSRKQALDLLIRAYALDGEDIFDADEEGETLLGLLRKNGLIPA
ncbi:hypothetical protein [Stenotrophomonas sp. PFBMAA-4]|uniref:tetratricopeptide repeat protein n=1 Tax=Stenotrophomonas sp. PFBMAA-4 TaxID=3043301 RepID=UPI0024B605E4|nr:hypothetical protein [Stenotrophomonas sp. PFBMAA-4]MDI9273062.1 hypothetical protein [Stenotrophomonas sp. PFBMAA-4]